LFYHDKKTIVLSNPLTPRLSLNTDIALSSTPRALSRQKSYISYSHITVTKVRGVLDRPG